jgi:Xaa-Pro aminopeptidase
VISLAKIDLSQGFDYKGRTKKAKVLMQRYGVDCLYLTAGRNQQYFAGAGYRTGWPNWLSCYILPFEGESIRVTTPLLEKTIFSSKREILGKQVYTYTDGDEAKARSLLTQALKELKANKGTIGFAEEMRVTDYLLLRDVAPEATLVNVSDTILDPIRIIKDNVEIELMRKSAELSDRCYQTANKLIKEGVTCYEVREACINAMLHGGADTATLSGTTLHHKLQKGDILDFEPIPRVRNYASETARCFFVGEPTQRERLIWDAIQTSFNETLTIIRPGVTMHTIDCTFRNAFQKGMKPIEAHYLPSRKVGHGMGLRGDGHEKPYVQENNMISLQPGMTICIDSGPGRGYLPDKRDYGFSGNSAQTIHLISQLLITESSYERLDKYPDEIQIR